jgi:hypothetical protein
MGLAVQPRPSAVSAVKDGGFSAYLIINTKDLNFTKENIIWQTGSRTLEEEQESDKEKEELAKQNRIRNYIVVDCRYSTSEWIKNSILNSQLAEIYDLSNIDWCQCEQFATSNLVKDVCSYWSKHCHDSTTSDLARIFKVNHVTIWKYLKQGARLGWCNYNAEDEEKKKATTLNSKQLQKGFYFQGWKMFGRF